LKNLPQFLLCSNNQSLETSGIVLSTAPPFLIGKPVHFKDGNEYSEFVNKFTNKTNFTPYAKIEGYRVIILFAGALEHVEDINRFTKQIEKILSSMAGFYLQEKIMSKLFKYKRYKEE
jgi:hypothetical protein